MNLSIQDLLKNRISKISEKPKTSTIEKLSEVDKYLANDLLTLCGTFYDESNHYQSRTPHTDPQRLDSIKSRLLSTCMKMGERIWYPRGNPGRTDSLHMPSISKKRKKNG